MAAKSSFITNIKHTFGNLTVDLHGVTTTYVGVPKTLVADLKASDSRGAFFNKNIRSAFPVA